MVTEGAEQEPSPDNIPTAVNTINDLLVDAHASVSEMAPEPISAGAEKKALEQEGLEGAVLKARDSMQRLCVRLNGLVGRVGRL